MGGVWRGGGNCVNNADPNQTTLERMTVMPKSLAARFSASSVKLYVNGRNLWTSTKWSGLDPEFTFSEQRTIPLERLITGGLNVRF